MRHIDAKKREDEILELIVKGYIEESKPISSGYLCKRFQLPISTATVRNVMESLERKGFLSHLHTSSGRVPTKEAFKYYVEHIEENDTSQDLTLEMEVDVGEHIEDFLNKSLDILADISGYTSLIAISGLEDRFIYRGMRFIFEQPEFEDIEKLKSLFYALEVKIATIQGLLFNYLDEKVKVLVGDDIGCEEISHCSLVISGFHKNDLSASLALIGPMRMDYAKAITSICAARKRLEKAVKSF